MKTRLISIFITLTVLLTACASATAAPEYARDRDYAGGASPASAPLAMEEIDGSAFKTANSSVGEAPAVDVQRMVIKNARLSIAVNDPPASMDRVSALAEELGGYVVSANLDQTWLENGAKVPRGSITIRVPAERLDEALDRIKAETAQPVISQQVSSQDVTAEYTDLESRLRNLEAAEQGLQKIMDAATNTEDIMSVYNQLVAIREQIEIIKGQMKYYEQSAALSSVSVELLANEAVQPLTIGSWQPAGVAKSAVQALINAVKFLFNALIWIVLFIAPVLLIVLTPPILIARAVLARRKRRLQAKEEAPKASRSPVS